MMASIPHVDFSGDEVSPEDASTFERIARALMDKVGQVEALDYDEDEMEEEGVAPQAKSPVPRRVADRPGLA